jgi:hypothetical protein
MWKNEVRYKKGTQERISIGVMQRSRMAMDLWVTKGEGGAGGGIIPSPGL